MDSEQIPLFYDFAGNAQFVFPTDFINTGTADPGMRVHLHETYASFQCMQKLHMTVYVLTRVNPCF